MALDSIGKSETNEGLIDRENNNLNNKASMEDLLAQLQGKDLSVEKRKKLLNQLDTISKTFNFARTKNTSNISNEFDELIEMMNKPSKEEFISKEQSTVTEQSTETLIIEDNTQELLNQLNATIEKKHQFLTSKIAEIYNSNELTNDVQSLTDDIQQIMSVKDNSIEQLQKVDQSLNSIISRLAKLSQKADELKTKEDFKINNQTRASNFLQDFIKCMQGKYGEFYFASMSQQEEEEFITLYCTTYNVTREQVKKSIDDSVDKAYQEKMAQPIKPNVGNDNSMENLIKYYGNLSVEALKEIHATLETATNEQIAEFNSLYQQLSSLSNLETKLVEDSQQKLSQLQELNEKIEALRNQNIMDSESTGMRK